MSDYDNELRGVLFKNDKKERDNQPDYKGNCEINGIQFWLSAWIKTTQNAGNKYMSLSFTPKERTEKTQPQKNQNSNNPNYADDDIPF